MMSHISLSYLAELVMINSLLTLSEYIPIRSGVFSLATPAFAAVGGFTSASLLVHQKFPVFASVLVGMLVAGVISFILALPLSRLRGVFQGIATLGVVIIVQNIAYLWTSFTGGAPGLQNIPRWAGFGPILLIFAVVIYVIARVDRSAVGQNMTAIRVDELTAASNGLKIFNYQLSALVASGLLGGLGGALLSGNQYAIDPSVFGFSLILQTVAGVFLGGFDSWLGPVFGAAILTTIPELFPSLAAYEEGLSGVFLILVILLIPRGVVPAARTAIGKLGRGPSVYSQRHSLSELVVPKQNAEVDVETIKVREGIDTLETSAIRPGGDQSRRHGAGAVGSEYILSVKGVSRSFAGVAAVSDVSLVVKSGMILGLIGPNGAGKSTLVDLISGMLALDHGRICIGDVAIDRWPAHKIAAIGIRRTFQTCRLIPEATLLENALIGYSIDPLREVGRSLIFSSGGVEGRKRKMTALDALERCGLVDLRSQLAGSLPYALQRRLEIARALGSGNCKILLLDEPAAGMTNEECIQLATLVRDLRDQENLGILLIEHHMNLVLELCDRVTVLASGKVLAEGLPTEVSNNEAVVEAYLGRRHARDT